MKINCVIGMGALRLIGTLSLSTPPRRCSNNPSYDAVRRHEGKDDASEQGSISRRDWVTAVTATCVLSSPLLFCQPASATESVGVDIDCNESGCLGVSNGLLADCPHGNIAGKAGAGCASSQDDTPGVFAEPWDYSEVPNDLMDWEAQMPSLLPAIQRVSARRGDSIFKWVQSGRYLRVIFTDGTSGEKSVGEFYFTPDDTTVQFRVASVAATNQGFFPSSSLQNLERCELIRKELGYLKVPVLRNRKRTLFFGESDLDKFGPSSNYFGSPGELRADGLEGRQEVDPNLKIDFLQNFPVTTKKGASI